MTSSSGSLCSCVWAMARCTSCAQRTASTTLWNSINRPSPMTWSVWPLCSVIFGSRKPSRSAVHRRMVRISSCSIIRLNPATSAKAIAVKRRRIVGLSELSVAMAACSPRGWHWTLDDSASACTAPPFTGVGSSNSLHIRGCVPGRERQRRVGGSREENPRIQVCRQHHALGPAWSLSRMPCARAAAPVRLRRTAARGAHHCGSAWLWSADVATAGQGPEFRHAACRPRCRRFRPAHRPEWRASARSSVPNRRAWPPAVRARPVRGWRVRAGRAPG